jgi:hypothetical protein
LLRSTGTVPTGLLHLSKGSSALADDGETPACAGRAAARTAPILALAGDEHQQ